MLSSGSHRSSCAARCGLLRLARRSLRAETYPWKEKGRSQAKRASNELLARFARCLLGQADRAPAEHGAWALVLDAPSLATSRALRRGAGFRPERILVPNDSDAAFGPAAAQHAAVSRGLSLGALLRAEAARPAPRAFACAFCDFTCCLEGSWRPAQELEEPGAAAPAGATEHGSSPREDLEALFRGGHLEPSGAVLGVTLARLRDPERSARHHGRGADQWAQLRSLVALLALRSGSCAVPLPPRIEQTAVATEFWLIGPPREARFRGAVEECCRPV